MIFFLLVAVVGLLKLNSRQLPQNTCECFIVVSSSVVNAHSDVVEHVGEGVTFAKVDQNLLAGRLSLQRVPLVRYGESACGVQDFVCTVRSCYQCHWILASSSGPPRGNIG